MIEQPNKWILVDQPEVGKKIYATWSGGYLSGDSWKLNRGVLTVEEEPEFFVVNRGMSSEYRLSKHSYGVAGAYNYSMLESLILRHQLAPIAEEVAMEYLEGFNSEEIP